MGPVFDTPPTQEAPAPPCDELPYSVISIVTTSVMGSRDVGILEARVRSIWSAACLPEPGPESAFATVDRCLLCFDAIIDDVYH